VSSWNISGAPVVQARTMPNSTAPAKKVPFVNAFISAIALYAFCSVFLYGVAVIGGPIYEHLRDYPRLTALVTLGFWLSPVPLIALGHSVLHRALDRFDPASSERRSGWVGLYSWLVALFATATSFFVVALIQPASFESDLIGQLSASMSRSNNWFALHTMVWILLSTLLYRAEEWAHRRSRNA
jgi:hypothetical protein